LESELESLPEEEELQLKARKTKVEADVVLYAPFCP